MKKIKRTGLPKLAHGEGTMSYNYKGDIVYKKWIKLGDGSRYRKTVSAPTITECFMRMAEEEKEFQKKIAEHSQMSILNDEMEYWLTKVKKNTLKKQSYERLESLIRVHIVPSFIGNRRLSRITSTDLQNYINQFNNGDYSYSSIKKIYDCLNAFFRYIHVRDHVPNPMEAVVCISKRNVVKEDKHPEFLDAANLQKFKEESLRKWKTSNRMRYRYGAIITANMYLGLRIGELLALKWKDIHFSENYILVDKTLVKIKNPKYDINHKDKMKKKNIKKNCFIIQNSTKTNRRRKVPINKAAKKYLLGYYNQSEHVDPEDFVVATHTGRNSTPKNIQDTMTLIIQNGNIDIGSSNTHIMRHTCASLLYNNGVDLHTIAKILGNSEEVLRKTYVHFEENTLASVMAMIAEIE